MPRCGSGSVPIAIGWKCTNCRRTHRSSIPRSAFGNTRARPELTTGTSQPPRNWSAPCHGSSERCNSILNRSDPICFLFADRDVPLLMRGCIDIPVNVTLMVIQDQHCPVFATALHLSTDLLLPVLKPNHGLAAPIRVGSGIDWILQHAEHRVVSSGLPDDLAHRFWPANDRQLDLLLIKPEIDLSHAAQLRKFAKDQIDSGPDPGIRIFLDAVVRSFDVPDRDPSNQGAPLCLLQ